MPWDCMDNAMGSYVPVPCYFTRSSQYPTISRGIRQSCVWACVIERGVDTGGGQDMTPHHQGVLGPPPITHVRLLTYTMSSYDIIGAGNNEVWPVVFAVHRTSLGAHRRDRRRGSARIRHARAPDGTRRPAARLRRTPSPAGLANHMSGPL